MYYLGIDLGGTNVKAGVVDQDGVILSKISTPTHVPCAPEEMNGQLVKAAAAALEKAGVTAADIPWIGVGCPGAVNRSTGVVEFAGNLFLDNYPLQKLLQDSMQKNVIVENDANAAAYGEYKAGALKGAKDAVAITLGTGIGSGVIVDGKILSGCNYAAGEMGHMVIVFDGRPCTCGQRGCWETYASATGLITTTKEFMAGAPKDSPIWTLAGGSLDNVTGRTAFDAMRAGDPVGRQIVDAYIAYLGCGIVNVINTFQPDILCVGGGICNEGETLMKPLREYVEKNRFNANAKIQTKIVRAKLGNDAGIIGAALLGE